MDPATKNLYEKLYEFKVTNILLPEYETQLRETRAKLSASQNLPFSGVDAQKLLTVEVAFAQRCAIAKVECLAEALAKARQPFDSEALATGLQDVKLLLDNHKKWSANKILAQASWGGDAQIQGHFRESFKMEVDGRLSRVHDKALSLLKLKHAETLVGSSPQPFSPHGRDAEFCRLAVEEARKSISEDGSKPMVGAVVARDGKVLSTAHRGETPKNHAEYIALEIKLPNEVLAGASVYTTLEPCTKRNHPKIPCAERLVLRKVGRVFIGMLDPNPDIQGHGVRVLRNANIEVQFFPPDLMEEIEELNRNFTRQFHEANRVAEARAPVRPISPDEQKIADILKFRGKPITVFNKQKYGHGYLEGTFDAVVVDCDSLGIILSTYGSNTPLSFSLSQIEVSRDMEKKTLKLTVYR